MIMQPNRAKYVTLMNVIQKQIENGTLKQGDKLPSVRNLSFDMQVTPGTVARAYKELIDQNILKPA
jgi:DNA-binding transcriptional regulator YhcF (GntR family)